MKFLFGNFLKSYSKGFAPQEIANKRLLKAGGNDPAEERLNSDKNDSERFQKGFTLVELLIYSLIFTVAAGLLTGILIAVSGIQSKENAAFEVTRQLQFVTQKIQYSIRDASVIEGVYEGDDEGVPCANYCSIKLRVDDPTLDPTIISSDIAGVYVQEGTGEKVTLTTAKTRISSLKFTKVGNPGGLSTVTVDFAMIYNPDDPQLRVEKRLASAIAHVSAATFDSDLLPDATESRNIGGTSLKWNNLILSGGINITGPDSVGEQIGVSMARGAGHGASSISQYYVNASPYNKYGQRYDVGGTPMLYLEGDIGQSSRRAFFMNGNVGIGTTSPEAQLDVVSAGSRATLRAAGDTLVSSWQARLLLQGDDYRGIGVWLASNTGGTYSPWFLGRPYASTGFTIGYNATQPEYLTSSKLFISTNGNVGIGTTSPAATLDVSGTGHFTGALSAQSYSDNTPYPENLGIAYDAVLSMKRLPDGEYDPLSKETQLDHSALTEFVRGPDGSRDLSATVSAQNEVIKDLIKRVEELENKCR